MGPDRRLSRYHRRGGGGANFVLTYTMRDALSAVGVQDALFVQAWNEMGTPGMFITLVMGPMFPVALLLFGIALMRARIIPMWNGMLLLGGAVCFPLGRIPHIHSLIYAANILLLLPLVWLGWRLLRSDYLEV